VLENDVRCGIYDVDGIDDLLARRGFVGTRPGGTELIVARQFIAWNSSNLESVP
jgi:hypothetical protein